MILAGAAPANAAEAAALPELNRRAFLKTALRGPSPPLGEKDGMRVRFMEVSAQKFLLAMPAVPIVPPWSLSRGFLSHEGSTAR
ncbi:MAG: hypothetical protein DME19_04960 [Verrucomicrobia bacterium]|nr:MAG: hypothetical protein DME19_04960 [Verrucomicrobiota bacterium]